MPNALLQTGPVEAILNSLSALEARDRTIEAEMRRCGKNMVYWFVGFGVSLILLMISFVLLLVTIGCLIGGIYWAKQRSNWAKQDMENRRLALAHHFFAMIGKDVPRKAKCGINLDFDGYRVHGKLLAEEKGGWQNPISRFKYEDTWFTARGLLYDGNRFRISITQTVNRKEKRKRKYTKVNERITEEVTLLLRVSAESYPGCAQLAQLLHTGEVNGLRITRAEVHKGMVRVACETSPGLQVSDRSGTRTIGQDTLANGDTLLRLFLYVYALLQQCRPQQAATG